MRKTGFIKFPGTPCVIGACVISAVLLATPCAARADLSVPRQKIERIPAGALNLPGNTAPVPFRISVRGATEADLEVLDKLRSETRSIVGGALGTSSLAVIEAFAIPGFFSGSLIAGAVFIAPMALTLSVIERKQYDAVERALQENSLIDLVRAGLQSRAGDGVALPQDAPALEVVVLAYGLTRNPVCLFADVVIRVTIHDRKIFEDLIYIEPFIRSSDAPPPICRSIEDFARGDGKLIKDGLIEYGQVVPAVVTERTRSLLWQD